jgi:hypothetical protein
MPVVEHSEFDRHNVSGSSFNSFSRLLYLSAEVERPGRIGSWRVKDSGDIVLQDNRGEETDIDISGNLEKVFVLPVMRTQKYEIKWL